MNDYSKPWNKLTQAERDTAYQDASLRVNDIDWYRFHGIDPRPPHCPRCASMPRLVEAERRAAAAVSIKVTTPDGTPLAEWSRDSEGHVT